MKTSGRYRRTGDRFPRGGLWMSRHGKYAFVQAPAHGVFPHCPCCGRTERWVLSPYLPGEVWPPEGWVELQRRQSVPIY
ncbi:hypothetical protein [Tomitella cavernea]|uniref:Uncharacterized protein n=1 Tax=Tomitella cavernea TaxID=1387982 RepID=A0ABP9CG46_9ACTN|nr:hypothetical protein [Tomitella cavernea]